MDDAARLVKAKAVLATERALRNRAEHELRMARFELTRAHRIIVGLRRQALAHKGIPP